MKKVLLTVALLGSVAIANAQISKGKIFVGGDVLGFSTSSSETEAATKVKGTSTTSFGLAPTIGYYLMDNIAIGAKVGYTMSSSNDNATPTATESTTSTIFFSPFVRYNMAMADKISFFGDLGIRYEGGSTKTEMTPAPGTGQPKDVSSTTFGVGVTPGFVWFVRDNIAVQASLPNLVDFTSMSTENPNTTPTTKTSSTDIGLSLRGNLGFGLYYYFGGSK